MEDAEKYQDAIRQRKNERYSKLYRVSEKVTNLNKTLVLSGIACAWILLNYSNAKLNENLLFIAIILFANSIFLEIIHYLIEIVVLYLYSTKLLVKQTENGARIRNLPLCMVITAWIFWIAKILSTLIGYVLIGVAFVSIF